MGYKPIIPGLPYLEDGDEVVLEGWCGSGDPTEAVIGFGTCTGHISAA